jgi:hypothetical protein
MAFILIKIVLSIGAFACFYWSFLILFSDKYFTRWQNTHWKEENDEQWSEGSVKFNRYARTIRTIVMGFIMLYVVFFL